MAEYIYCINPDKNTIREISEKDGIVVWNIPCVADKVTENDTIYLYINTGDDKNKNSYICYSGCIAYKATVLEVLADRNKKKLLKLHIFTAFQTIRRIFTAKIGYIRKTAR